MDAYSYSTLYECQYVGVRRVRALPIRPGVSDFHRASPKRERPRQLLHHRRRRNRFAAILAASVTATPDTSSATMNMKMVSR